MCCAWIAAGLIARGYLPETPQTAALVSRWRDAPPAECLCSRSVDFLLRTGRTPDLDFILTHIDDLHAVFPVHNGEVRMIPEDASLAPKRSEADRSQRPAEAVAEC